MKVILLSDVKNLGKKGDIVETAEGYGRNYLIPRKLAKEANTMNMNQALQDKKVAEHRAAQRKDEAVMLAAQVDPEPLAVAPGVPDTLRGCSGNPEPVENPRLDRPGGR